MWTADLTGGVVLVFGAEGKGVRPLVRRACDATVSIPLAGKVESLNVSVAAALLLYEAASRESGMADPTLYLFDGHNLFHAGAFASSGSSPTASPLRRHPGRPGRAGLGRDGVDPQVGALSVRYAAHADDVLERLAAENRDTEVFCSSMPIRRPRHRARGAEATSGTSSSTSSGRATRSRTAARIGDSLDDATRERLERMRRGRERNTNIRS